MVSTSKTPAEIAASVNTVFTLPDVYLHVKMVVDDPDSCMSDMVNAISIDPGISARVLALVNSAYFSPGVPVDDMRQAVNRLGMQAIHNLVLATVLSSAFVGLKGSAGELSQLWRDSVIRACYTRLLGEQCAGGDAQQLFIEGLLADIGHLVLFLQMAETMRLLLQQARAQHRSVLGIERQQLGFDAGEVGFHLLNSWNLPPRITSVVRFQSTPAAADRYPHDAALVHIASALTMLHDRDADETSIKTLVDPSAWALAGLDAGQVLSLRGQARLEIIETLGMLSAGHAAA